MQAHISQDAGTHLSRYRHTSLKMKSHFCKMQAYNRPTRCRSMPAQQRIRPMIYISRCRLKELICNTFKETDYNGYALKQLLQQPKSRSLHNSQKSKKNFESYSVALRFKTTDGCSRSFAKRKRS